MLIFAAVSAALAVTLLLSALWYGRLFHRLANLPVPADKPLPRLSVIVPACDEAATIRATAESILQQDYTDLELVLIDDRSTDQTGVIMDQLVAEHPGKVRALHVHTLPPGWLGKNHALWVGTQQATGAWLLFTDADLLFDPTCFRRAVGYSQAEGLDHLAMFPRMLNNGYWLGTFVSYFVYVFCIYNRVYRANDPRQSMGTGSGSFNLIRREAYAAVGTHAAISLRPDDDVRLGHRVKRKGLHQRFVSGAGMSAVAWYPSLWEAVRGLEKNALSVMEYSGAMLVVACLSLIALDTLPYLLVWLASGMARWLFLGTMLLQAASFVYTNGKTGNGVLKYFLAFPLGAPLLSFALLRAGWLTLRDGGIRWRGTFYSLKELKGQTGFEGL